MTRRERKAVPQFISAKYLIIILVVIIVGYIAYALFSKNSAVKNSDSTFKTKGQFCGGIAGLICPEGYACKYDGDYPDAGGECVKK